MSETILVLEDDEALRNLLAVKLESLGYHPICADRRSDALELLTGVGYDAVLMNVCAPDDDVLDLCRRVIARRPRAPIVLVGARAARGPGEWGCDVEITDSLTDLASVDRLDLSLRRVLAHARASEDVKRMRRSSNERPGLGALIGGSLPMEQLYDVIERVAPSHASVLLRGESGSGKELIARALHALSPRGGQPFVAINCAAMPDALLESELFGVERGAFTDAKVSRAGLLRQAHGGTLFLDEIGDMSPQLQPKLLRALQERCVRPVGGEREIPFDTRIIAATHRDLDAEVAHGRFRADLFFRLNVVSIGVPPLRERLGDIGLLAGHFLAEFARRDQKNVTAFTEPALRCLEAYAWPGNVRELRNGVEHAVAMARGKLIDVADLPPHVVNAPVEQSPLVAREPDALDSLFEVERRHIMRVLAAVDGNKSLASKILGIDRKTLHARLVRYQRESAAREPRVAETRRPSMALSTR